MVWERGVERLHRPGSHKVQQSGCSPNHVLSDSTETSLHRLDEETYQGLSGQILHYFFPKGLGQILLELKESNDLLLCKENKTVFLWPALRRIG